MKSKISTKKWHFDMSMFFTNISINLEILPGILWITHLILSSFLFVFHRCVLINSNKFSFKYGGHWACPHGFYINKMKLISLVEIWNALNEILVHITMRLQNVYKTVKHNSRREGGREIVNQITQTHTIVYSVQD